MAAVRIRLRSDGIAGIEADHLDTASFASPTAAVAGVASGFLIVTPTNPGGIGGLTDEEQIAINVTAIAAISQI